MTGASARIDSAKAFQEAFGVSRETLDRLLQYEELLKAWQKAVNLVSPATLGDVWHRHFADSAQLLNFAPVPLGGEGSGAWGSPTSGVPDSASPDLPRRLRHESGGKSLQNWLDLGSGGGFPGLVLAILLVERRPEARMTLVESDARKAAFLGEVARKTGVAVEILTERSEKAATQAKSRRSDVITARALAPLPKLLGLVLPFFSPQTVALFPKGREAAAEVAEAEREFDFQCSLAPSLTDADARIAVIRNLTVRTEG